MHVEVSRASVRGVADFADKRLLAGVRQQVPLQRLVRVEAFAANLAVRHVLLIVLLLVQAQVVSGDLGDAAYVAGEAFVVLLQVGLQEFLGLEALGAQDALKRPLLLVRLDHVLLQLLLVDKLPVAFVATALDRRAPLVALPVLQKLLFLQHSLAADLALVNCPALATRVAFVELFADIVVGLARFRLQLDVFLLELDRVRHDLLVIDVVVIVRDAHVLLIPN